MVRIAIAAQLLLTATAGASSSMTKAMVAVEDFTTGDASPAPPLAATPVLGSETKSFLSSTLGSNMVLQRDVPSVIWGFAEPGTTVEVTVDDGSATLTTTAGTDGVWRSSLPPRPASLTAVSVRADASTGESAVLENVLFGDVYLCGGQSNMQFSMPANSNSTEEARAADRYPHVRLFTVGQGTASDRPLDDLQTIKQPWSVASYDALMGNSSMDRFSSVCWFFGRTVADGLDNEVPVGLVSNNWGGTLVELWSTTEALTKCKRTDPQGKLYNAMIHPYTVGPMAVSGFTWYQGEANTKSQASADAYACLFPAMISSWREKFAVPEAFFGFVQLSTWCPKDPASPAELREAQMKALDLPGGKVGYSTNADHGAGCNIHPPDKKPCGTRLGNSALALNYGKNLHWKSPSYAGVSGVVSREVSLPQLRKMARKYMLVVAVELLDVGDSGLRVQEPFNLLNGTFDCSAQVPGTCAYGAIEIEDEGWVSATANVKDTVMILTAVSSNPAPKVLGTAYGWGSVPMLTIYDKETDLPVLPWKQRIPVAIAAREEEIDPERDS